MELFETLKLLTEAHGVSGREAGVRAALLERVRGLCDEHTVDVMGDLICHRRGPGPRVMLSAPMDTAGVVISHIQPDGYLRFAAVGGLTARQLAGRTVRFANGMTGLIAVTPDKAGEDFTVSDLYLDVGAGSRGDGDVQELLHHLFRRVRVKDRHAEGHVDQDAGDAGLPDLRQQGQIGLRLHLGAGIEDDGGVRGVRG